MRVCQRRFESAACVENEHSFVWDGEMTSPTLTLSPYVSKPATLTTMYTSHAAPIEIPMTRSILDSVASFISEQT